MILLTVDQIRKHYGPEPVLAGASFTVRPGDRIGLVGPNGAGKTTLLRIIAGNEEPDAGTIQAHPSATLGFLQQQAQFTENQTVWQLAQQAVGDLVSLAKESDRIAAQLAEADEAQRQQLAEHFDELQNVLHQQDGYQLDYKIERVLDGLGFSRQSHHQSVLHLSGGFRRRVLLAQLLLYAPDLMLLDEPSNHLDVQTTQWLEEYLGQCQQSWIVVSHDRYFLDRVTNRTLELFAGTTDSYKGNFSAYWRQKSERVEIQRKVYQRQQEEIAKLEDFVRRHHVGQKHMQAEDRRKKLQRIERVAPPREIHSPTMAFPLARRSGDIVLRGEHLRKAFDEHLFDELTFEIERGHRWCILGANGSGKTTLLRCLLGSESLDGGQVNVGTGVKIGYLDQHLSLLNADAQVVDAIRPSGKEFTEPQRRDLLARFGLTGNSVFQKVSSLSGGEKMRAALALLSAKEVNVLVLDEPTNHLDMWSCDALEKALKKFDGTVLFVSHDRFFINQVADHLLVLREGGSRLINGNYDLYRHMLRKDTSEAGKAMLIGQHVTNRGESNKTTNPASPKRKFPYRKLADIETEITEREQRVASLQLMMTDASVAGDGPKIKALQEDLKQCQQLLTQLYEHWEQEAERN